MSQEPFEDQMASAALYFQTLARTLGKDWHDLYAQHLRGELSVSESATLANPLWYEGVGLITPGRAHRSFAYRPDGFSVCESLRLWNYECPLSGPLQIDHVFPWALGGPTKVNNAMYLCREHNLAKGHDIHLISWASSNFEWLEQEIEDVRLILAEAAP